LVVGGLDQSDVPLVAEQRDHCRSTVSARPASLTDQMEILWRNVHRASVASSPDFILLCGDRFPRRLPQGSKAPSTGPSS
jgi:hypothetical protein